MLMDKSSSRTWSLKEVKELRKNIGIQQTSFTVLKESGYQYLKSLHNLPAQKSEHSASQALWSWIKAGLDAWGTLQFPVGKNEQQAWVMQCLRNSTRGFANPGVAANVSDEVQKLLTTTVCGKEAKHLLHVLEFCDFRGSEVSLRDGTVSEGNRQVTPYPAMVWAWRSVQAYAWQQPQHINILE